MALRRSHLSESVAAGLLTLLLLLGAVAGPLSMWMLERHTLATSPKVHHYFVEGCAGQISVVVFVPWGLVALVIVAFLLGARSRTAGISLTSLAVGWQVSMVWLIFDLGLGWCGDPDGASLVRDATPGWLGPVWLAWLALGVALGIGHVIALIRIPMSPPQPAVRTGRW
ncbi:MAG: hypothetical protein ACRDT2_12665 [Natronosporangium sp.]